MNDLLLNLTGTIAANLKRVDVVEPETRDCLFHLVESVQNAAPQPYLHRPHPYASIVAAAIEIGMDGPGRDILERLSPVQNSLPWVYHYPARSPTEDLADQIAFAELVGPDGPLGATDCRVGFTVVSAHTTYPWHSHPASELYLVLAGHAEWRTPTSKQRLPPGNLVLHRSGEPHSMVTSEEPLLALWCWSGDIGSPAVYV